MPVFPFLLVHPSPQTPFFCPSAIVLVLAVAVYRTFSSIAISDGSQLSGSDSNSPSIGFSLTSNYGTVVIRNSDGSVVPVAKVEVDDDYKELMRRLSQKSSVHPSPPYNTPEEDFGDRWRQFRRRLRKRLGKPASADVGTLSHVIAQLRQEAEAHLDHDISAVLSVIPNAIALYDEDICDAMDYVGLRCITGHNVNHQSHGLQAAYAGYGLGLCEKYADYEACAEEEQQMPQRQVFAIDFTQNSLSVDMRSMTDTMYVFNPQRSRIDWEAGLASLQHYPDPEAYWDRVRAIVLELPLTKYEKRDITTVLLLGESALNDDFLAVVHEVLGEVQTSKPDIFVADPVYVAAKGAAELAKRIQEQGERTRGLAHEQGAIQTDMREKFGLKT